MQQSEPPDSYWDPDGGARVGRAREILRPRSGENFGVVAALVKPPAAVAASTRREREGKQRDFLKYRVVSLSRKNTKIHYISREMEMEMQQPQEGHMGVPWVLFLFHVFFFFSNFLRFGKKWGKVRTTPNIKNYQTQRAE